VSDHRFGRLRFRLDGDFTEATENELVAFDVTLRITRRPLEEASGDAAVAAIRMAFGEPARVEVTTAQGELGSMEAAAYELWMTSETGLELARLWVVEHEAAWLVFSLSGPARRREDLEAWQRELVAHARFRRLT
jgi:hypothetical protein